MLQSHIEEQPLLLDAATLVINPDLQGSSLIVLVGFTPDANAPVTFTGVGCEDGLVYLERANGERHPLPSVNPADFELAISLNSSQTFLREMGFDGDSREYPISWVDEFAPGGMTI